MYAILVVSYTVHAFLLGLLVRGIRGALGRGGREAGPG